MTIRDEAGEYVAKNAGYHDTVGGDKYWVRYNGMFLVAEGTDILADKLAKVMLSERLKKS